MAGVEIGTLRLRGPPHLASRAAFGIEDGLRTELADTQRLILIRRMPVGGRAARGRPEERSGAIRLAYEAATRDSRHGLHAGDGAFVNCVWFESPAEARRLLLAELLAGRRPTGWFWRLAVPEWRGRPLDPWLSEIVASALCGGAEERDSLSLVLFALGHSDVEPVMRALQAGAAASPPPTAAPVRPMRAEEPSREEGRFPVQPEGLAALPEAAEALRARLPEPIRCRIEKLARRLGPREVPVLRLLERLLLQASPSLALAPAQLRGLASAWSVLIEGPARSPAPARRRAGIRHDRSPGPAKAVSPPSPPAAAGANLPSGEIHAAPAGPRPARALEPLAQPPPKPEIPLHFPRFCASDAAGLWLVIPSLIRLGFREWLCERPDLLREDAGRTLLRTVARHHRVLPVDPALAPFEALGEIGETPDWAIRWRAGLDRWLRRRARMPLHRLVWKRGEVTVADDALTVRFPLEAADIRLRRRALDVDPGWVDWLGLSVRYRYEGKAG